MQRTMLSLWHACINEPANHPHGAPTWRNARITQPAQYTRWPPLNRHKAVSQLHSFSSTLLQDREAEPGNCGSQLCEMHASMSLVSRPHQCRAQQGPMIVHRAERESLDLDLCHQRHVHGGCLPCESPLSGAGTCKQAAVSTCSIVGRS